MTDAELIARLRDLGFNLTDAAAARIEALTAERDQHWDSFVHWRKEADDRSEQLAAARQDAKEAEAYVEELEQALNTTRMAQAVMDNTVADLEAKLATCEKYRDAYAECDRIGTQAVRDLEVKLAKAVEALLTIVDNGGAGSYHLARATLAEIKGESHE